MENSKVILIIEDEKKIAEVIESYLQAEGYRVHKEYNGIEGLNTFNRINPTLVILDLMLPDVSGEDICKTIRKKSRVPIIMLTAKVLEEDVLTGLDIGADDYVTKPFSPRQLMARIRAILRRVGDEVMPLSRNYTFNNQLSIDCVSHEVKKDGEVVHLTPNEYKILLTLIKYPARIFSRSDLIFTALGDDYDGYDRTIDTHIKNLRQKLEDDTKNPKYILTVHGVGYRFGGE
jgi:DNA-binding response OmpR family regulator